jgi:hypothetical protein
MNRNTLSSYGANPSIELDQTAPPSGSNGMMTFVPAMDHGHSPRRNHEGFREADASRNMRVQDVQSNDNVRL